jgi:predicted nucleic acid-binding protein
VIAAERRGETPSQMVEQALALAGDQEASLSSIGLTELVHGIYRANTPQLRLRRKSFIDELRMGLTIYPFTADTALIAGQINGEQTARGVIIPFPDLLIGATALSLCI